MRGWANRARASRAGRVLVTGPAGIGKSSLVGAFAADLSGASVVVVQAGRCHRPGDFLTSLGQALGARPSAQDRDPVAALLHAVGDRQDTGLLVLVLEDLQEIDDESVPALVRLLQRLRHDQVLTVATARDELVPGAWRSCFVEGVDSTTRVLGGLDAGAVRELSCAVRPGAWPPAAVEAVVARTTGHPLHLLTVLREVSDDVVTGHRPLDAHASLADDIDAAVERLPAPARAVLAALAVLGTAADRPMLARLAGLDPHDVESALEPLVTAGLVGTGSGPTVRIQHPLQADAVRAGLPPAAREALHRAAAHLLGGRAALHHRIAAAAGRPDPGLAADLERSALAEPVEHGEAADRLLAAADVAPDGAEALRLRLAAAVRLVEADDAERLGLLREDVRHAEPGAARSTVLGYLAALDGEPTAVDYLESAAADVAAPDELRALAGVRLAQEHTTRARGRETVAAARAAASLTRRSARREQARIFEAFGRAHEAGPAAGLRVVEAATAGSGGSALVAGILHQLAGDVGIAHGWFRASLDRARRQEDRTDAHEAHIYLAETLWRQGRWDLAAAQADVALAWFADGQRPWLEAAVHAVALLVPAGRGDEAEARRHLTALRAAAARYPGQQAGYALATGEAVVARASAPHRMLAALGDLPARAEASGLLSAPFTPWRVLHAEALLEAGRAEQAAATVQAWAAQDAPLWFDLTRHRLLARIATAAGDDAGTAAAVRAGLDLARADEQAVADACPVELAELHLVAGAHLVRRGRGARAAVHLEAARATFVGLGAKPWIERVDALARDEGAAGPVERLTPRERQVAGLVADGMTNREVADELWVTPKAVDYHLGNVFRKLGIGSRRELRGRGCALRAGEQKVGL
nr:LuxR family transcriptional regulator [Actinomycetospora corticicola]